MTTKAELVRLLEANRTMIQAAIEQLRVSALVGDWDTFDQVLEELRNATKA
jgi:hypothetical protein